MPPKTRTAKAAKTVKPKQEAAPSESQDPDAPLDMNNIDDLIDAVSTKTGTLRFIQSLAASLAKAFEEFKSQLLQQRDADHALIEELSSQLAALQQLVAARDKRILELEEQVDSANRTSSSSHAYESPIRKQKHSLPTPSPSSAPSTDDPVAREFEYISYSLDMVEIMTGVRVRNFVEEDDKFFFEVRQRSSDPAHSATHADYVLIIEKSAGRDTEICYIPAFMDQAETGTPLEQDNSRLLQQLLPDYFCGPLNFAYSSLPRFYARMGRALCRGR